MFGKKLKLRSIIDKHQDYFQDEDNAQIEDAQSPAPPDTEQPPTDEFALDLDDTSLQSLICGYLRCMTNVTHIDMLSLHSIFENCYPFLQLTTESIKFDRFNTKYGNAIYNVILRATNICRPMSEVNLSCHRVFSTSVAYKRGVVQWRVKYIEIDKQSSKAPYGAIGIISQNKALCAEWADYQQLQWLNHRTFGSVIYWDQACNCIYSYEAGKGKVLRSKKKMKDMQHSYQQNDVITVILNCKRWTLRILKNGENILRDNECIDIVRKNVKYYPVVAFYHHGDSYRAIVS